VASSCRPFRPALYVVMLNSDCDRIPDRCFAPGPLLPSKTGLLLVSGSALRGWGGLLGAGLAVAIGFFGVSVAMRGVRRPQASAPVSIANRMPPARERPALPASSAVPVAVSAPSTIPPSPATPSALAARESGHSVRPMRDRPVPATPTGLLVAERESLNDVPSRPHALRRASDRDQPAQAPSSTRRAGARVSSSAPRAGLLSKDDF
jgi:hypothetical protein